MDGHRLGLVGTKEENKLARRNELVDLIREEPHDPEAGERGIDRGLAGVDGETRAHGDTSLAPATLVLEGPTFCEGSRPRERDARVLAQRVGRSRPARALEITRARTHDGTY